MIILYLDYLLHHEYHNDISVDFHKFSRVCLYPVAYYWVCVFVLFCFKINEL